MHAISLAVAASPVAVVSAPSGYGKTTAVADWAEDAPMRVAWLTLGPLDSAPGRLVQAVLQALNVVGAPEYGDGGAETDDPAAAYRLLCDAYSWQQEDATVLVVDDAHCAGEAWQEGLLGALVAQPPDALRVLLVGNTLIEATLPRLALMRPEVFIRAESLAFDEHDLADLQLAQTVARPTPAEILHETGGWPIAVRLMLLGATSPATASPGRNSVRQLNLLRDYVRDYVLRTLPADLAKFILDSSVCADLTPALARAVTGVDDAQARLDECVHRGLFLDRFDTPAGPSYRWHAVFARQCVSIRHSEDAALTQALHTRAAVFLEAEDPLAAARHAALAGGFEFARDVLSRRWIGLIVGPSAGAVEAACVELALRGGEDPSLLLIQACATDVSGQHRVARELFARGESALVRQDVTRTQALTLNLARLFLADDRTAASVASAEIRRILASDDGSALADRAAINYLIGWSEIRHRTNSSIPAEYFSAAAREATAAGDRALARRSLGHLAFSYTWSGQFARASAVLDELDTDAVEAAPWNYYAGGSSASAAGYLAYWRGDIARALAEFTHVIAGGSSSRSFAGVSRMMIAYAAAESKDIGACRRAAIGVQELPSTEMHGISWPAFRESGIAMLEEAVGREARASEIARRYMGVTDLPVVCVAMSGILRRAGDLRHALEMLRGLRGFASVTYVKVATLNTAALLRREAGDLAGAHDLCEAALEVAAVEDLRLAYGPREEQIRRLLTDHVSHGTRFEDFIAVCLAEGSPSRLRALTQRELSIFRQFQTTRTLPEIAAELGLSVNTVKTHQRSIYRKLGVNTRRDAVHAAM